MPRKGISLAARENFRALDEIYAECEARGIKATRPIIREGLKERGRIVTNDETVREWEDAQTLKIIKERRDLARKRGEIEDEPFNLFEVLEDGKKKHYFKPFRDMSTEEIAQHLNSQRKKIDEDMSEYYRVRDAGTRRDGESRLSLFISWAEPVRPLEEAAH